MASTALVKDVLWRVAVQLQDTAPQFQQWPERELVHWLNDAQVAIAKYVPLSSSRVDTIKLAPGSRQSIAVIAAIDCKPGDGSIPTAPVHGVQLLGPRRNMGADGITAGRAIRMVERDTLDSQDPDWPQRVASSVASVIYDPQTPRYFYVTPGVTGNVWIEIAYAAKPVAIVNTATPPSEAYKVDGASTVAITVDDEFVEDLVDYVVARAHLKDVEYAEPAKAQFHTARFLASLNAKAAAVGGTNPNLTVMPGVTQAGAKS